MAHEVKVYSTPTCPWCMKTKKFLDDNKVTYQSVDVSTDKAGREEMIAKSEQMAVPVVEIDGEIAVGFDEKWLKQKLNL